MNYVAFYEILHFISGGLLNTFLLGLVISETFIIIGLTILVFKRNRFLEFIEFSYEKKRLGLSYKMNENRTIEILISEAKQKDAKIEGHENFAKKIGQWIASIILLLMALALLYWANKKNDDANI